MRLFTNQSFVFVCTAILMETTRQANLETNFTLEIVETIRKSHAQSLAKKNMKNILVQYRTRRFSTHFC